LSIAQREFLAEVSIVDEQNLVLRAKEGDSGAFELLVRLHYQGVYQIAFRFMKDHAGADDVVQDTFVKAHKYLGNFRGDSSFKSWLLRIAINTAKNALRSGERHRGSELDEVTLPDVNRGYQRLEKEETLMVLRVAIDKLPPRQKLAIELRIFEDMGFQEVADAMECPFDTAKANFRHALMNLKKILEKAEGGKSLEEMRLALEAMNEDERL
jgi:RNA polymerase sigma-70 factor (ECF subfamily)